MCRGARACVSRPLSLCLPGPLALRLPFCNPLTGLFCSRQPVGCESGPRRPLSRGHAGSFLQDPGPGPDCGVGAPPQPFSPLTGPSTPLGHHYRPIPPFGKYWAEPRKCHSTLLLTEHQVYTASKTGGEPTLLGPALRGEKQAVSAAQWGAEHHRGPGVQGWGLLCPHRRVSCASVPHPHSTEGPQGSPILTPGYKLRKQISKVRGLVGKHPAGRAMQSPGLAAKWPSPSGWRGGQHSRDATRLHGPGTGWSRQLACHSRSGNSAREGRRRSDHRALEAPAR